MQEQDRPQASGRSRLSPCSVEMHSQLLVYFAAKAGAGVHVCFLLLGGGACLRFCCLGGQRKGRVFVFAVWVGSRVSFFSVGTGTGVHSLTGLPGLFLRGPTTKKTKHKKKICIYIYIHIYIYLFIYFAHPHPKAVVAQEV